MTHESLYSATINHNQPSPQQETLTMSYWMNGYSSRFRMTVAEIMENIPQAINIKKQDGKNTVKYFDPLDKAWCLRYNETTVTRKYEDGTMTIDMEGWDTYTTRERVNREVPNNIVVYSDKNASRIYRRGDAASYPLPLNEFYFDPSKSLFFQYHPEAMEMVPAGKKRLFKKVLKYVESLDSYQLSGREYDNSCWICGIEKQTYPKRHSVEHLLNHIEDGKSGERLLHNALRWRGCRNYLNLDYYGDSYCRNILWRYLSKRLDLPYLA